MKRRGVPATEQRIRWIWVILLFLDACQIKFLNAKFYKIFKIVTFILCYVNLAIDILKSGRCLVSISENKWKRQTKKNQNESAIYHQSRRLWFFKLLYILSVFIKSNLVAILFLLGNANEIKRWFLSEKTLLIFFFLLCFRFSDEMDDVECRYNIKYIIFNFEISIHIQIFSAYTYFIGHVDLWYYRYIGRF